MESDTWDDGATYEPYVGRWSRVVAESFLSWLAIPMGAAWLDFGCGTGALSHTILANAHPRLVIGCDRSPGYVAFARERAPDLRAQFVEAQLPELPRIDGGFDVVVAGLVLNFLPTPMDGATAMMTRVRRGGTVAAYVWDYADGMQLMRVFWDTVVELDPVARVLDEGTRFPLCRPEPLTQLFNGAGLRDVAVESIEVPTVFQDFDDYWLPFLGGQGPAPGYAASLPPERQAELREAIRRRLPSAADGTIPLTARAWAVKGIAA
ncbi:MAG TPA: class I SAM-dependent methyltransferase [Gemmatimonadales bacterium]|nr:class I SAM-dependent methyltransferase [Gemmatimonadales bacterium]